MSKISDISISKQAAEKINNIIIYVSLWKKLLIHHFSEEK